MVEDQVEAVDVTSVKGTMGDNCGVVAKQNSFVVDTCIVNKDVKKHDMVEPHLVWQGKHRVLD